MFTLFRGSKSFSDDSISYVPTHGTLFCHELVWCDPLNYGLKTLRCNLRSLSNTSRTLRWHISIVVKDVFMFFVICLWNLIYVYAIWQYVYAFVIFQYSVFWNCVFLQKTPQPAHSKKNNLFYSKIMLFYLKTPAACARQKKITHLFMSFIHFIHSFKNIYIFQTKTKNMDSSRIPENVFLTDCWKNNNSAHVKQKRIGKRKVI